MKAPPIHFDNFIVEVSVFKVKKKKADFRIGKK